MQRSNEDVGLLYERDIAKAIHRTVWTVQRMVKAGILPRPFQLFPGGPKVWRTRDFDAFLEKRKRARRVPPVQRGKLKKPRRRVRIIES